MQFVLKLNRFSLMIYQNTNLYGRITFSTCKREFAFASLRCKQENHFYDEQLLFKECNGMLAGLKSNCVRADQSWHFLYQASVRRFRWL